jgi:phosphatidylserine/phosphatidylglycerophosphate/cardiolipin synthase-like enzyme
MGPDEMEALLRSMLDDHRLSRAERRALRDLVDERGLDDQRLGVFRAKVFDLAREQLGPEQGFVVDWLEDAIKALLPREQAEPEPRFEARFSPGLQCLRAIVGEFENVRTSADICVFTITDDRIVEAMVKAHRRGVAVRVITDDDKSQDLGSDVERLGRAGIDVRMDDTPNHMHHKFAVFDNKRVLTGSYNWTRSAADRNHENIVLSDDAELVLAFGKTFERLWDSFA